MADLVGRPGRAVAQCLAKATVIVVDLKSALVQAGPRARELIHMLNGVLVAREPWGFFRAIGDAADLHKVIGFIQRPPVLFCLCGVTKGPVDVREMGRDLL